MSTASEAKRQAATPTVSEAKRAANARNGKRGGPRTAEGKARSRMNGLVHGLRAEVVVLPGESEEAFRHRLDAWAGDLQPHGAVERYHVETAVAASWRRDRCLRTETAVLTDRILDAADPDPEAEDARARRLGARLAKDPAAVAHKLRQTAAGCLWMLAEWDDLDATIDSLGFWEHSRLHRALALLGYTAPQWRHANPIVDVVVAALSARNGKRTTAAHVRYALGGKPEGIGKFEFDNEVEALATICDDQETGRAELKQMVAAARAELRERLEWVEAAEARRQATAADRAAFDDSASGQKRQRYEAMHDRALRSALRDLRAEQKRRAAVDDAAPDAPSEPTASGASGGNPADESLCGDRGRSGPEGEGSGGGPVPGVGDSSASAAVADAPSEPAEASEAVAPTEPTATGPIAEILDLESSSGDEEVEEAPASGPGLRSRTVWERG